MYLNNELIYCVISFIKKNKRFWYNNTFNAKLQNEFQLNNYEISLRVQQFFSIYFSIQLTEFRKDCILPAQNYHHYL